MMSLTGTPLSDAVFKEVKSASAANWFHSSRLIRSASGPV